MLSRKKKILITMFVAMFICNLALIPFMVESTASMQSTSINNKDLILDDGEWVFTNENFEGLVEISGDAIVTFIGCTFDCTAMRLSENAIVTFQGCLIQTDRFDSRDFVSLLIEQQSTLVVRASAVHGFQFQGHSQAEIYDSEVYSPMQLFEILHDSQFSIYRTKLEMASAMRVFDRSTVLIADNSEVNVSIIYMAFSELPEGIASLTISTSAIHCPILNIQTMDNLTAVIIQDATVEFVVDTLWVTGSQLVTIIDNELSGNSQDYQVWSPFVQNSIIQERQFAVICFKNANVYIESSDIFGAMTAGASEINISNSIVYDVIGGADLGQLNVKDTTIRGQGLGKVTVYGTISLGSYFALYSQLYFGEFYPQEPVISLIRCTVHGIIRPHGYHTVIFQYCTYNRTIERVPNFMGQDDFLAIHIDSEEELYISGYSRVARVYRAELTINDHYYGSADQENYFIHFQLDPPLSIPCAANFEVVAITSRKTFTREFTIELVSEVVIIEKLEQLTATVLQLPDSAFDKNPSQRKTALWNKLQEVMALVELEDYAQAYDKLLHDLKPKLTGLKTDEQEAPWGNGVFKNPWVVDPSTQELFRLQCNALLYEINLLF